MNFSAHSGIFIYFSPYIAVFNFYSILSDATQSTISLFNFDSSFWSSPPYFKAFSKNLAKQ